VLNERRLLVHKFFAGEVAFTLKGEPRAFPVSYHPRRPHGFPFSPRGIEALLATVPNAPPPPPPFGTGNRRVSRHPPHFDAKRFRAGSSRGHYDLRWLGHPALVKTTIACKFLVRLEWQRTPFCCSACYESPERFLCA